MIIKPRKLCYITTYYLCNRNKRTDYNPPSEIIVVFKQCG